MIDPLSALSIAGNVVQFTEFAGKLLSKTRKIYNSADGALVENLELEAVARNLMELSSKISGSFRRQPQDKQLTWEETSLRTLCDNCVSVAEELLALLEKLRVKGKHGKWDSFRKAVKTVGSESELDGLSRRLEGYRRQLDTLLLASLRTNINHVTSAKNQPKVKKFSEHFIKEDSVGVKEWQTKLIDTVFSRSWKEDNERDVAQFSSMISGFNQEERTQYLKERLLRDLQFLEMPDRHERIATAHRRTFRWMFEPSAGSKVKWTDFVKWLQNDDQLYWITGKAGSGKSTLMKYIYGNRRTRKLLKVRDNTLPVITAGFFFWNSGTEIQMSQQGLLQTLLYESLSKCEDLIPLVFPQRWNSYEMFGQDFRSWSDGELLQGFKRLVKQDGISARFCFFVDGLDEFDGDPAVLINLIKEVVATSKVKVCLSSRPWLVFEDAFRHHSNLMLQDLTYPDIMNFISSELGANRHFLVLKARRAKYADKLINDIATKADGVFLWVKLVVTSLLAGLTNSDRISDLQRRLDLIPPDLEDLYGKMLDSFDAFYLEHASQLFQLVRASYRPISLLCMSFADEEDATYAVEAEVKTLTDEEKLLRCEETRRRLNSRCKGLLEVPMTDIWPAASQNSVISSLPHHPKNKGKEVSTQDGNAKSRNVKSRQQKLNSPMVSRRASQEDYEDSERGDVQSETSQSEESDRNASLHQTEVETDLDSLSSDDDDELSGLDDVRERLLSIDVNKLGNLKIEYLHRTVKDFLEKEEVWSQLLRATSSSFNPHLSLCRANLLLLKVQDPYIISEDAFWECIMDCLNYAAKVEIDTSETQVSLIDELGRVADIFDARGVELARKAGIAPVLVDKDEPIALGIWSRIKQEKVAQIDVSWHEQYGNYAAGNYEAGTSTSDGDDASYLDPPLADRPVPRINIDAEVGLSPEDVFPREWQTPEPVNEEIISEEPESSEQRGRTEQPQRRTPSPSQSRSRSRSQSAGPDASKSRDIPAKWKTPRKISRAFRTHWPGTHPEVELSCTFHCFVTLFGLPLYLTKKLEQDAVAVQERGRRPFLDYLIVRDKRDFVNIQPDTTSTPPNVILIKAALENGADPNQKYAGITPWQNLLKEAQAASKASHKIVAEHGSQDCTFTMKQWADIVELFLKYGADPLAVQNSSTANAIRDIFWDWDVLRTKKLEKMAKHARHGPSFGRLWSKD